MDESEYGGGGPMPNGIFPQEPDVILSASDQLMLMSSTGQTDDSHAPVNPYYWFGEDYRDPVTPTRPPRRMTQAQRYRESPSQY